MSCSSSSNSSSWASVGDREGSSRIHTTRSAVFSLYAPVPLYIHMLTRATGTAHPSACRPHIDSFYGWSFGRVPELLRSLRRWREYLYSPKYSYDDAKSLRRGFGLKKSPGTFFLLSTNVWQIMRTFWIEKRNCIHTICSKSPSILENSVLFPNRLSIIIIIMNIKVSRSFVKYYFVSRPSVYNNNSNNNNIYFLLYSVLLPPVYSYYYTVK